MGVVSRFRGSLSEWSGVSNPDDCGTRVKSPIAFHHGMMVGRSRRKNNHHHFIHYIIIA